MFLEGSALPDPQRRGGRKGSRLEKKSGARVSVIDLLWGSGHSPVKLPCEKGTTKLPCEKENQQRGERPLELVKCGCYRDLWRLCPPIRVNHVIPGPSQPVESEPEPARGSQATLHEGSCYKPSRGLWSRTAPIGQNPCSSPFFLSRLFESQFLLFCKTGKVITS